MKTVWTVISGLLLIHLLLLIAGVAWLRTTGRLDQQRVDRMVEMFKLTITEEKQQADLAAKLTEEISVKEAEAARQERIANGPATMADRLDERMQAREIAQLQLERAERDVRDLQRQMQLAKQVIAQQKAELDEAQRAFEAAAAQREQLAKDDDFRQAVAMLEQVKARQAKQMFQEMIEQEKSDQVIDYLAAMQLRKAAAVLREFKTEPEIEQATQLIQQLRTRGIDVDANGLNLPPIKKVDAT